MSDFQRPAHSMKREVGAAGGDALLSTLVYLWPYIWPADRRDLKIRVGIATLLIFAAKLATVAVPFTFKWATDALAGHGTAPLGPDDIFVWALATPVMMTATRSDNRVPITTRVKMSSPTSSVPNQCAAEGGCSFKAMCTVPVASFG